MNDIDIKNIKKFIAKIKAQNFKFKEGGDCTYEYLDSLSLSELKGLVSDYKNRQKHIFSHGFKKKVDEIFEKFAEEGENIIILTCCNADESGRSVTEFEYDNPLRLIDFNTHKRNEMWYPVGSSLFYDEENYEKSNELYAESRKLLNDLLENTNIDTIDEYYNEDDSVNFYWYGVYGVTKDYKVVTFIIRDDGILSDYNKNNVIKTI